MNGFSAEWLALREPFDQRARNPQVLKAVSAMLRSRPSVRIADLACGAGSTVRALHKHLQMSQHWDLVDNDPHLLAIACSAVAEPNIELKAMQLDLSRHLEKAVEIPVDLIAMSALLDLISETWLQRLMQKVMARALPMYAALTYDGRTDLSPADPGDASILFAFNAHQRTDKGFGPALGPAAAKTAISGFRSSGYEVVHGSSDWVIGPHDRVIQMELLQGWANAARETMMLADADIAGWLGRRINFISAGLSWMSVGHVDLLAFPSATR